MDSGSKAVYCRYSRDKPPNYPQGAGFCLMTQSGEIADMNYIWKILTVLHNHSLANGGRKMEVSGTERYMPFLDLQYNVDHANRVHLNDKEDLLKLFMWAKDEAEQPKIRITTAAKNTKEELIRQISKKANDLTKDRSVKTDK